MRDRIVRLRPTLAADVFTVLVDVASLAERAANICVVHTRAGVDSTVFLRDGNRYRHVRGIYYAIVDRANMAYVDRRQR